VIKTLSQEKEVVMVGVGPIGIELLETLNNMDEVKNITLLSRGTHLYDKNLSVESIKFIEKSYLKSGKIKISYEDEIVDTIIEENEIKTIKTKKLEIKNPFLVFGVGIKPNIDFFKDSFKIHKGILVNDFMQTSEEDVYAVGECAEVESMKFVAGHVKECTNEADTAIAHIFGEEKPFEKEISIDMLKVKGFELVDVRSPEFNRNFEKVVISSKKDKRIDEYFIENERLVRFIGINSNVDVSYVENFIKTEEKIDVSYLYENRLLSQRGRLVCSCKKTYYQDIVDIVVENGVTSFSELAEFSEAGRVCGRCKKAVDDIIKESHCSIKDLKRPFTIPCQLI
jgi:quinone-reactive Ni/Fe-hydrogenase small subunit